MKKYLLPALSLVIVLAINLYFRSFPVNFPQLKTQARAIVMQNIRQESIQQIQQRFPDFSPPAKERLLKMWLADKVRQNRRLLKSQIQEGYRALKGNYQDESGQTYLMELDGWHWARYVENTLRLGHPGDKVINGKQWDALMLAPQGSYLPWHNFLFYLSAYLYKFFSPFKLVTLHTFLFYLPLFFMAVFTIALYLFSFRYGRGIGATISCLLVGLAPIFLPRSCAGWFDTDILNLFFPLLVVWFYLKAVDVASLRQKIFWLFLSAFWLGIFSFTWPGWWFILLIILVYAAYSLLNNLTLFKERLFMLVLFLIFSFIWIMVFSGLEPIKAFYPCLKEVLVLNKPISGSIWPNVLSTVSELRRLSLPQLSKFIGGMFLLDISLFCMLGLFALTILRRQRYTAFYRESIIILIIWFISTILMAYRGMRVVIFSLIPMAVSIGWMVNEAYIYFRDKKKKWLAALVLAIALSLSLGSIGRASNAAKGIFPLMNDAWYDALVKIKNDTPQDAVINSWWDFGDWFKAVCGRRVIFDGYSQLPPQAHWMARVLMSGNEEEAIRILRMLNNAGNGAFEIINKQMNEPLASILLLEKVLLAKDQEQAREILANSLPSQAVQELIKLLFFPPAAKAYFVVDPTMPSKVWAFSYLGNWDFSKVYLAQNINKKDKAELIDYLVKLGKDRQKAERFYQEASITPSRYLDEWISEKVGFRSNLVNGYQQDDMVFFGNTLFYKPNERAVHLYSEQEGRYKTPKGLFLFEDGNLTEIAYPDGDLGVAVAIFKIQGGYQALLLDHRLASSMFMRLHFFNGNGLKHFKPFIEVKAGNEYIRVFEIVWD